jgi:hypothetical protein
MQFVPLGVERAGWASTPLPFIPIFLGDIANRSLLPSRLKTPAAEWGFAKEPQIAVLFTAAKGTKYHRGDRFAAVK